MFKMMYRSSFHSAPPAPHHPAPRCVLRQRHGALDGLGAKERAAIASLAEALGVTAQSVTAIETLIEQHDAA